MAHRSIAVAVAVLTGSPLAGQATAPVPDSVFAQWTSTHGPGCTVGVDLAGTRATRAYGMANLESGVPLRPESVIESGSVAVAAHRLRRRVSEPGIGSDPPN